MLGTATTWNAFNRRTKKNDTHNAVWLGAVWLGPVDVTCIGPMAYPAILFLPNGEKIFNTGVDDFGDVLPGGESDTHYEFTRNPANSLTNPFVASAGYLSSNSSAASG